MEFSFSKFIQEGLWIWGLFLLGIVACFFLLAQKNAGSLLIGILRSLWSLLESPFRYLRKTILEISQGDSNPRLQNVDHYLLRRMLTSVQIGLLVFVFLASGLALATAVEVFLPSAFLRHQLTVNRERLDKVQTLLQQNKDAVAREDAEWNSKQEELTRQIKTEEAKGNDIAESLRKSASAITSLDGKQALSTVQEFLDTQGGSIDRVKSYIKGLPLNESESQALIDYCDHWYERESFSKYQSKTPDQIRNEAQPEHANLVQQIANETAQISDMKPAIAALEEQVVSNYHPGLLVLTLLAFLVAILVCIWVIGTSIEVFSMAIYLSNDVKQIRTQTEDASTLIPSLQGAAE